MLDLDPYGGTDPLGMFSLFLKRTADVIALCLSVVFWWFVRPGSFTSCFRQANVTPILKGPLSSSIANNRLISTTSLLSDVFELLGDVRLGRFMECSGVLPTTQFVDQKGRVPVMRFWECPIQCNAHWRLGKRFESCRLISVQPLIGSTVRASSISSALWVLEVLCCLY